MPFDRLLFLAAEFLLMIFYGIVISIAFTRGRQPAAGVILHQQQPSITMRRLFLFSTSASRGSFSFGRRHEMPQQKADDGNAQITAGTISQAGMLPMCRAYY